MVLLNEFAGIVTNEQYTASVSSATKLMDWCALSDPQAQRLTEILLRFEEIVDTQRNDNKSRLGSFSTSPGSAQDLSGNFVGQDYSPDLGSARRMSDASTRRGSIIGAPVVTMLPPPSRQENGAGGPAPSPTSTSGYSHSVSDGLPVNVVSESPEEPRINGGWHAVNNGPPPSPNGAHYPHPTLSQQPRFTAYTGFATAHPRPHLPSPTAPGGPAHPFQLSPINGMPQ
jgi:hypothetical protein